MANSLNSLIQRYQGQAALSQPQTVSRFGPTPELRPQGRGISVFQPASLAGVHGADLAPRFPAPVPAVPRAYPRNRISHLVPFSRFAPRPSPIPNPTRGPAEDFTPTSPATAALVSDGLLSATPDALPPVISEEIDLAPTSEHQPLSLANLQTIPSPPDITPADAESTPLSLRLDQIEPTPPGIPPAIAESFPTSLAAPEELPPLIPSTIAGTPPVSWVTPQDIPPAIATTISDSPPASPAVPPASPTPASLPGLQPFPADNDQPSEIPAATTPEPRAINQSNSSQPSSPTAKTSSASQQPLSATPSASQQQPLSATASQPPIPESSPSKSSESVSVPPNFSQISPLAAPVSPPPLSAPTTQGISPSPQPAASPAIETGPQPSRPSQDAISDQPDPTAPAASAANSPNSTTANSPVSTPNAVSPSVSSPAINAAANPPAPVSSTASPSLLATAIANPNPRSPIAPTARPANSSSQVARNSGAQPLAIAEQRLSPAAIANPSFPNPTHLRTLLTAHIPTPTATPISPISPIPPISPISPSPPIEITIGHIEVRVSSPPPTLKTPRRSPQRPALSLKDYLNRRNRP